ncbi:hypothetical protein ACLOJK_030353 [Asimina triloba]
MAHPTVYHHAWIAMNGLDLRRVHATEPRDPFASKFCRVRNTHQYATKDSSFGPPYWGSLVISHHPLEIYTRRPIPERPNHRSLNRDKHAQLGNSRKSGNLERRKRAFPSTKNPPGVPADGDEERRAHTPEMTCKHHPAEKGFKGVCAFCLSDRLSALRAASGEAEDGQESDPAPTSSPPATALSPSASIAHCPSAADRWGNLSPREHQKRGRLSFFWCLLRRSRSTGKDSHPQPPPPCASKPARIASSWVCAFRRKKKSRLFSVDDEIPAAGCRKPEKTTIDRGLSPRSSPEASPDLQEGSKMPVAGAVEKKARRPRQLSKLSVCLSPLVRARPGRSHRHDRFFACKFRGGNRHGQSTEPTLGPNRSKKIADFGKKQ